MHAVRLYFIDKKVKVIAKDFELQGRCDFLVLFTVILHFSQSPIVTIIVHAFKFSQAKYHQICQLLNKYDLREEYR